MKTLGNSALCQMIGNQRVTPWLVMMRSRLAGPIGPEGGLARAQAVAGGASPKPGSADRRGEARASFGLETELPFPARGGTENSPAIGSGVGPGRAVREGDGA